MNTRIRIVMILISAALLLCACGSPAPKPQLPQLPSDERGPYAIGMKRALTYPDPSRPERKISLTVWYPADLPKGTGPVAPILNAKPDRRGAPYPLILSSSKVGRIFAEHLVSYGFIYIGIDDIDTYYRMNQEILDQPLDILFALDQVAKSGVDGLDGMFNAEQSGVMGYSFDGTNDILLSGARLDPQYYLTYCQQTGAAQPPLKEWYVDYYCTLTEKWEAFASYAGSALTSSNDGLWQPITDKRIRAVMPMAPDGAWLTGEKGLAAADRPVLMIQASRDSPYQPAEGKFMFEHLGSPEKRMISFVGQEHMMIYDAEQVTRMAHFATAFFGYYLQGREDYKTYLTEEYVSSIDGLAWGFFEE